VAAATLPDVLGAAARAATVAAATTYQGAKRARSHRQIWTSLHFAVERAVSRRASTR
jgi:hypothetical protein